MWFNSVKVNTPGYNRGMVVRFHLGSTAAIAELERVVIRGSNSSEHREVGQDVRTDSFRIGGRGHHMDQANGGIGVVAEQVYAGNLKFSDFGHVGSNPTFPTKIQRRSDSR